MRNLGWWYDVLTVYQVMMLHTFQDYFLLKCSILIIQNEQKPYTALVYVWILDFWRRKDRKGKMGKILGVFRSIIFLISFPSKQCKNQMQP